MTLTEKVSNRFGFDYNQFKSMVIGAQLLRKTNSRHQIVEVVVIFSFKQVLLTMQQMDLNFRLLLLELLEDPSYSNNL